MVSPVSLSPSSYVNTPKPPPQQYPQSFGAAINNYSTPSSGAVDQNSYGMAYPGAMQYTTPTSFNNIPNSAYSHVQGGNVEVQGGNVQVQGGNVQIQGGNVQIQGGNVQIQGGMINYNQGDSLGSGNGLIHEYGGDSYNSGQIASHFHHHHHGASKTITLDKDYTSSDIAANTQLSAHLKSLGITIGQNDTFGKGTVLAKGDTFADNVKTGVGDKFDANVSVAANSTIGDYIHVSKAATFDSSGNFVVPDATAANTKSTDDPYVYTPPVDKNGNPVTLTAGQLDSDKKYLDWMSSFDTAHTSANASSSSNVTSSSGSSASDPHAAGQTVTLDKDYTSEDIKANTQLSQELSSLGITIGQNDTFGAGTILAKGDSFGDNVKTGAGDVFDADVKVAANSTIGDSIHVTSAATFDSNGNFIVPDATAANTKSTDDPYVFTETADGSGKSVTLTQAQLDGDKNYLSWLSNYDTAHPSDTEAAATYTKLNSEYNTYTANNANSDSSTSSQTVTLDKDYTSSDIKANTELSKQLSDLGITIGQNDTFGAGTVLGKGDSFGDNVKTGAGDVFDADVKVAANSTIGDYVHVSAAATFDSSGNFVAPDATAANTKSTDDPYVFTPTTDSSGNPATLTQAQLDSDKNYLSWLSNYDTAHPSDTEAASTYTTLNSELSAYNANNNNNNNNNSNTGA